MTNLENNVISLLKIINTKNIYLWGIEISEFKVYEKLNKDFNLFDNSFLIFNFIDSLEIKSFIISKTNYFIDLPFCFFYKIKLIEITDSNFDEIYIEIPNDYF